MVGTPELLRIATVRPAEEGASMAARVVERADPSLVVTCDQDGVLTHRGGEVVVRFRQQALVAEKQPAAREYLLQLLIVDLLVDEELTADEPIVVDDRSNVDQVAIQ